MGWFGCDNATVEKRKTYKERFDAYLKEAQEQGLFISVYDFHI